MRRFITENVKRVAAPSKPEQIMPVIEEGARRHTEMKGFFERAVARYGDVLQKPAE